MSRVGWTIMQRLSFDYHQNLLWMCFYVCYFIFFHYISGSDLLSNIFIFLIFTSFTHSETGCESRDINNQNLNFTLTRPSFVNFCKERMQNFAKISDICTNNCTHE